MEEIREIPEGWEIDSISKLCDIVDYRGKTPEKVDMGTFLVTAKNIRNGKIDYNISQEYVKTEKYEEIMSRGLPKIGDVLITTEAPLGEVASIDNQSIALAQRIIKLRGKKEKLDNKYLKYYMLSKEFQKEIKNDATGSTVEGIKGSRLKNKMIKFPKSQKEQLVIAYILDKLDQNIQKTEQTIEKYKKIKSGLMDDLLTGKIRIKNGKWVKETEFKEVEGVGRVPKDWDVNTIKESTYLKGRIGWQGLRAEEFIEQGPYLVTGTDFKQGKVKWENCYHITEKRYNEAPAIHLKNEDVLVTKDGTIGKVAYVELCPQKSILNSGIFVIRCLDDSYINKYLYYILTSKYFKVFLNKTQNGSTINHLYQGVFEIFKFPIQKIDEQKQIIDILSKQDHLIEKEQQYLEKLKKLKAGLMEDLLTGKVRVKIEE